MPRRIPRDGRDVRAARGLHALRREAPEKLYLSYQHSQPASGNRQFSVFSSALFFVKAGM